MQALKAAIREADAMLIATPEYNYGVPGVLKNAIDWASRPAGQSVLNRKPAAIMGCSQGLGGTIRAQHALRQSFVFTDTHAMLQPEIKIPSVAKLFDASGKLTDDTRASTFRNSWKPFSAGLRASVASGLVELRSLCSFVLTPLISRPYRAVEFVVESRDTGAFK